MKQIQTTNFSKKIADVYLYRDDIEKIINILISKSLIVEIYDKDNVYENLDELISIKGNKPLEIKINAKGSNFLENISIDLTKKSVWIFSNGSATLYSIGFEIFDLINSKRIWYKSFFKFNYFFIPSILSLIFVTLSIDFKNKTIPYPWTIWIPIILYSLVIFTSILNYFGSTFSLIRKHEYGFFKRNKDSIILSIISLIAGSILTLIFQHLTNTK